MAFARGQAGRRFNRYGHDFLIDKIQPDKIGKELVNLGELVADEEWQIINDSEHFLQEDHSITEREIDLEQSEIGMRENTNLRILEWMREFKNKGKEGESIQQVDVSAEKHVKTKYPLFGWTATDRPLRIPTDDFGSSSASSTETSISIFVRGVRVELTHTENLNIKKLREVRETNGLELDQEEAEPTIGRSFETNFEIPNKNSENILITDSVFIL